MDILTGDGPHLAVTSAARKLHRTGAPEILILDDNATSLAVLHSMLQAAGHVCVAADSPITALDIAESNDTIKVVLTDIYMPGMDGFQFVKALKESCAHGPSLQILMLTGQPNLQSAVDALRLGACDFLTKPVAPARVIEAVTRAMQLAQAGLMPPPLPSPHIADILQDAQELAAKLWALTHQRAYRGFPKPVHSQPVPPERSVLHVTIALKELMQEVAGQSIDERDWDLLLEIARSTEEGRDLSVSGLMVSVNSASSTTVLRRINRLWHHGFILKKTDPNDRRRDFVTLTPKGQQLVSRFLEAASKQTGLCGTGTL